MAVWDFTEAAEQFINELENGGMTDTQETNEFDRFKYLENLLNINQEMVEEYSKRIREQQKTIGNLTDTIDEMKAQIGKMQNVGNCKHAMDCAKFNEKELIYGKLRTCKNCKDWELAE